MMTLMSVLLTPGAAYCRLKGDAELGYVNYDSSDNDGHIKENSFTQRYSILYDASGKFVNGRLGKYDVSLGYEWLSFRTDTDTDIKSGGSSSSSLSQSKGHLLYDGEVTIDPKEAPFRLTLHSRDLNRTIFITGASNNTQIFNSQGSVVSDSNVSNSFNSRLSSTSVKALRTV